MRRGPWEVQAAAGGGGGFGFSERRGQSRPRSTASAGEGQHRRQDECDARRNGSLAIKSRRPRRQLPAVDGSILPALGHSGQWPPPPLGEGHCPHSRSGLPLVAVAVIAVAVILVFVLVLVLVFVLVLLVLMLVLVVAKKATSENL
jgi:Flp pilus assembly protein TadB